MGGVEFLRERADDGEDGGVDDDAAEADVEASVGDKVSVEIFEPGDRVAVCGTSKGKGFQGVMKRHGFGGGRATHGSMFHRAPGSIGGSSYNFV